MEIFKDANAEGILMHYKYIFFENTHFIKTILKKGRNENLSGFKVDKEKLPFWEENASIIDYDYDTLDAKFHNNDITLDFLRKNIAIHGAAYVEYINRKCS